MSAHIPGIMTLCLQYITYDPNYNYDDEVITKYQALTTPMMTR